MEKGTLTSHGAMLPPSTPMCVSNRAWYYTISVMDEENTIEAITEKALLDQVSNDVFETDQGKEAVLTTVFSKTC